MLKESHALHYGGGMGFLRTKNPKINSPFFEELVISRPPTRIADKINRSVFNRFNVAANDSLRAVVGCLSTISGELNTKVLSKDPELKYAESMLGQTPLASAETISSRANAAVSLLSISMAYLIREISDEYFDRLRWVREKKATSRLVEQEESEDEFIDADSLTQLIRLAEKLNTACSTNIGEIENELRTAKGFLKTFSKNGSSRKVMLTSDSLEKKYYEFPNVYFPSVCLSRLVQSLIGSNDSTTSLRELILLKNFDSDNLDGKRLTKAKKSIDEMKTLVSGIRI